MNKPIEFFVKPLRNFNNMLTGLYIIYKLEFLRLDNFSTIVDIVNIVTNESLLGKEIENFIKVSLFSCVYPLHVWFNY
jgi:hypothetical protein